MLVLHCKIIIGKYVFDHVHEVKIDSSRSSLADQAIIRLPQKYDGEYLAKHISVGDNVEIKLSYQPEEPVTEFKGYVSQVKPNIPVEIICEDEMYKLKRSRPKPVEFTGSLKELILHLVPKAKVEAQIVTLKKFRVDGKGSTAYALQKLKENFGLDIYFRNGVLFAGLAYTDSRSANSDVVNYDLEKNVINPQLNFRKTGDVKLKVKAISILPDNKRLVAESGDSGGALKTIHFYNLTTMAELQQQADETLKHLKYEGFDGSITTFGVPYCEHGQVAGIVDPRFDARKGNHFIDRVVTTFGTGGFRRQVFLGRRAS